MTSDAKKIGDALDSSMKEFDNWKGISQAELSRRSGVPQPTISRTLKGLSVPETETLAKLVAVVGVGRLGKAVASLLPAANSGAAPKQTKTMGAKISHFVNRRFDDHPAIAAVVNLMMEMDDVGKGRVLQLATQLAEQHAKTNPAKSSK